MAFTSSSTRQEFPFKAETVFHALRPVLRETGFTVRESDPIIRRVEASTGASAFSWGENLSLIVTETGEATSAVEIESALKFGVSGAGRHQKHFRTIIMALSKHLQGRPR